MDNVILFVIGAGIVILVVYLFLASKLKIQDPTPPKSEQEVANEVTEEMLIKETKRQDYNEEQEVGKD